MATTTPTQQNLQAASEKYSASFTKGNLALPPAKKYLVLTCMDARIDPAEAFGIDLGDAHVVRNAGASAHDALRSIIISQQLLGTTEVLVIKHTGCGMLTFQHSDAVGVVAKNLGPEAVEELKSAVPDFLTFPQLEEAVKSDVQFLKGSKLIGEGVVVSGWVYECETGKTRRVV